MMKNNRRIFMMTAFATIASLNINAAQKNQKPNVLLLLADDMGYGELGCYGHEYIKTPVLDKLAKKGIRFTDFHAGNAVSSASRAVLMTGIGSGNNTIRGNSGFQMGEGRTRVALKETDITMAEMLKSQGYQTAFVGKWHLENPCDMTTWAYARGFDFAAQEQWGDADCKNNFREGTEYINGVQDSLIYDYTKWECKDAFRTQIALDYIDRELDPEKPFFMFMSYRAPHAHEWDIRDNDLYKDRNWPEEERVHAAKITMLDKQIGRLLDKLDGMGLLENTIIIFSSDNGPQNEAHDYGFHKSNGALRGYKRDMFEGGHRVPFIMYWKDNIEAGLVSDYLCGGQDVVPTIANATGAKLATNVTGQSLLPLLLEGEKMEQKNMYHEMWDSGFSRQSVRMGNWKAVRYGMNHAIRLYDLSTDLGETKDLAKENPEVVKQITPLFEQMRTENKYFPRRDEDLRRRFLSVKSHKNEDIDFSLQFQPEGIHVYTTDVDKSNAVINVDYKLEAKNIGKEKNDKVNVVIRSIVFDETGNEIIRTSEGKTINKGDEEVIYSQKVELKNPIHWAPEKQTIYYVKSEIAFEDKVIEEGITSIEIN